MGRQTNFEKRTAKTGTNSVRVDPIKAAVPCSPNRRHCRPAQRRSGSTSNRCQLPIATPPASLRAPPPVCAALLHRRKSLAEETRQTPAHTDPTVRTASTQSDGHLLATSTLHYRFSQTQPLPHGSQKEWAN